MSIFRKPSYSTVTVLRDIPKNLWTKCPKSGEIVYNKDLEANLMVVPKSGYHFGISAQKRIDSLVDPGSFREYDKDLTSVDPLDFKASVSYPNKIEEYQKKTGMQDAVISGVGKIEAIPVSLAVMDFRFLGASMGSVVGEKITRAIERGLKMVPLLIHLPPPSDDSDVGNRDIREVIKEKVSQAEILYELINGTASKGFKSTEVLCKIACS